MGKRAIELAAQSNGVELQLVWKPFQLNPGGNVNGEDKMEAYMRKFGPQARSFLQDPNNQIAKRGREIGIDYKYHEGSKVFNTIHPHRLMYYVLQKKGVEAQNNLQEILFRRYFSEGQNLGPVAKGGQLMEAAVEAGLDKEEIFKFLNSDECTEEVQEEMVESHSKVSGVPHFYFPASGKETSGGQPIHAFQKLLLAEQTALDKQV